MLGVEQSTYLTFLCRTRFEHEDHAVHRQAVLNRAWGARCRQQFRNERRLQLTHISPHNRLLHMVV